VVIRILPYGARAVSVADQAGRTVRMSQTVHRQLAPQREAGLACPRGGRERVRVTRINHKWHALRRRRSPPAGAAERPFVAGVSSSTQFAENACPWGWPLEIRLPAKGWTSCPVPAQRQSSVRSSWRVPPVFKLRRPVLHVGPPEDLAAGLRAERGMTHNGSWSTISMLNPSSATTLRGWFVSRRILRRPRSARVCAPMPVSC